MKIANFLHAKKQGDKKGGPHRRLQGHMTTVRPPFFITLKIRQNFFLEFLLCNKEKPIYKLLQQGTTRCSNIAATCKPQCRRRGPNMAGGKVYYCTWQVLEGGIMLKRVSKYNVWSCKGGCAP